MDETFRMLGEPELAREPALETQAAGRRGLRWPLLVVAAVSAIALGGADAAASKAPNDPANAPDLIERWVAAHPQAVAKGAEAPDLIERWLDSHRRARKGH